MPHTPTAMPRSGNDTILGGDGYARKVARSQVYGVELLGSAGVPPPHVQPGAEPKPAGRTVSLFFLFFADALPRR